MTSLEQFFIRIVLVFKITPFLSRVAIYHFAEVIRTKFSKKLVIASIFCMICILCIVIFGLFSGRRSNQIGQNFQSVLQKYTEDDEQKSQELSQNELTELAVKEEIQSNVDTFADQTGTAIQFRNKADSWTLYAKYRRFLNENPATVEILLNAATLAVQEDEFAQAQVYLETAKTLSPTL